jgi:hypothetical protein
VRRWRAVESGSSQQTAMSITTDRAAQSARKPLISVRRIRVRNVRSSVGPTICRRGREGRFGGNSSRRAVAAAVAALARERKLKLRYYPISGNVAPQQRLH